MDGSSRELGSDPEAFSKPKLNSGTNTTDASEQPNSRAESDFGQSVCDPFSADTPGTDGRHSSRETGMDVARDQQLRSIQSTVEVHPYPSILPKDILDSVFILAEYQPDQLEEEDDLPQLNSESKDSFELDLSAVLEEVEVDCGVEDHRQVTVLKEDLKTLFRIIVKNFQSNEHNCSGRQEHAYPTLSVEGCSKHVLSEAVLHKCQGARQSPLNTNSSILGTVIELVTDRLFQNRETKVELF